MGNNCRAPESRKGGLKAALTEFHTAGKHRPERLISV